MLAAALGSLILLRLGSTKNPAGKAVAFLSIPAISAVLWVGFFVAIYGRPDPSAPYGPGGDAGSFAFVPGGLGGLLFDQRFGLVTYAPVVAVAFAGLVAMFFRQPFRRLALELLFVITPYLLTVTHFAMWWGGSSPPARFFAPVLPLFAVPAAVAWTLATGRATRIIAADLGGADRLRLGDCHLRRSRPAGVQHARRAVALAGVARAARRSHDRRTRLGTRHGPAAVSRHRHLDRCRGRRRVLGCSSPVAGATAPARDAGRVFAPPIGARYHVAVAIVGVGVMVASTAVWAVHATNGRTASPSQLELLERASTTRHAVALQLNPWSRLPLADVPGRLRIELSRVLSQRRAGRETAPLFALPAIPAGRYRLSAVSDDPRGWLMVGIAHDPRDPFALQTVPVSARSDRFASPGPGTRAGHSRRRRRLAHRPRTHHRTAGGHPAAQSVTAEIARRAVRYEPAFVYFLDERSFPEPQAFWVGGSRDSTVVVQPVPARRTLVLTLRNAPVENRVTLESRGWEKVLTMAAGEEQRIEIPVVPGAEAVPLRITASSGFRPSEVDAGSRDERFLGVWVKVEGD